MNGKRTNLVLGAALVVQVALVAIVHLAQSKPEIARLEPIITIDASEIVKLEIFDRVTDAKDLTTEPAIVLKKTGAWKLASHHDYPADGSKVEALLTKLVGMSARAPVATKKTRHRHLRVAEDKFERRLVIHPASGSPIELYIGASAGRQQTAVRLRGDEKTYGATGITAYGAGTTVSSWLDTVYFKTTGPMSSVEVTGASGALKLRKVENVWTRHDGELDVPVPEGKEIDAGAIDSFANRLLNIQLLAPADPSRPITPRATVVFSGADGAPHTLKIGDDEGDKTVIVVDDKVPVLASKAAMATWLELTEDKLYRDPAKPGDPPPAAPPGLPPGMMPPGGALPPGIR